MNSPGLARIDAWYAERGRTAFGFQREVWTRFRAGESGLLNAPTGSGKTLAAWLGPVSEALDEDAPDAPGLRVLWITPLRALANDLAGHLRDSATALGLDWRIELRTGDTSSGLRARQRRQLPHALITTPESLSVLQSYPETDAQLHGLRAVIVDEWHELLGSKRGVLLELALARVRARAPRARTWGLSATIANLAQARDVLLGASTDRGALVRASAPKTTRIDSLLPDSLERFPWAGHLGLRLLEPALQAIAGARSTLVFTNTRSQAEIWYRAIVEARPEWLTEVAIHHGSIAREVRARIEDGLRAGTLRCVVCTSSLDLGVDFAPVDQVLQIGSPKGIARLLQRAGRSHHRPGEASRVLCVPTHALELAEVAAARDAERAGLIEARRPLERCLDVLAQHLVTLASGPGFVADAQLAEVRTTHAYRELSDAEWFWTLAFITHGGPALAAYPQYRRVQEQDGVHRIADARLARLHRTQIGTITSDGTLLLKWLSGGTLGTIEESFLARRRAGDAFVFAGRVLELVRVRDMVGYVRLASRRTRTVPRWNGGRMPLSSELSDSLLATLSGAAPPSPELALLAPLLALQARWSRRPNPAELLVECIRTRQGHHLYVYPFAGRAVHEGLATLLAHRYARERPATFTLSANDYGFELLSPTPIPADAATLRRALAVDGLVEDLASSVNVSEIARRQFRDIARIAGLVLQGLPGRAKTTRQLQASSGLLYDVLARHDPGNRLVDQSVREVLEGQLESRRLRACLERLASRDLAIVTPPRLTPLAFPLWAESLQSQRLSSESWEDRVLRMVASLERAANGTRAIDDVADARA